MNCKVKQLCLAVLCLFLSTSGFAQQSLLDSLRAQYDSLQPQVSTGVLIDRNPQSLLAAFGNYNPLYFDGVADSVNDELRFKNLYETMYYAAYPAHEPDFHPADFKKMLDSSYYGQSRQNLTPVQLSNLYPQTHIVLGFMDQAYQMLSPMARDSGYLYFNDTISQWQLLGGHVQRRDTIFLDTITGSTHPNDIIVMDTSYYWDPNLINARSFTHHRLFTWAALQPMAYVTTPTATVNFRLSSFLRHTTTNNATYEIDLGDGNGFVPLPSSENFSATYPSFGDKTISIRTSDGGDGYLVSRTKISIAQSRAWDQKILLPVDGVNSCTIQTSDYGVGWGSAFVLLREGAPAGSGIQKPFIVVEGLETTRAISPTLDETDAYGHGELNWNAFSSGNFRTAKQLALFPVFMDSMRASGYDVILLDIATNRTQIQTNGNLLINLLQYVQNQLLTNGSDEQMVLVGASMGGLVSRWGLRKMELEGCCHNVRLFGTFSTPHRGANIPLGLQTFLYHMGQENELNLLGKGDDAKFTYDNVLNSPAARQMLVLHRESSARPERLAFQAQIDSMGLPQHCRKIALTNGSGQGLEQRLVPDQNSGRTLDPGDVILGLNVRLWSPLTLPGKTFSVLSAADILNAINGNATSGNGWTLLQAKAYAMEHSPHQPPNQLILERGRDASTNLLLYGAQNVLYLAGTIHLIGNGIGHAAGLAISALFGCSTCPQIYASLAWTTAGISASYTAALLANWGMNENANYNMGVENVYENRTPTLAYDGSPGDFNVTQGRVEELSGGLVKAPFPHHAFIHSISALDIDTNDLFLNIDDNENFLIKNGKTPFEAIWFNKNLNNGETSINMRHVEISDDNISWIIRKLKETEGPITSTPPNSSMFLSSYYNYGLPAADSLLPPEKFIKSTDILNNGRLHVNKNDKVGYQNSNYGVAPSLSHFYTETTNPDCGGSIIRVKNGGVFTIGDDNYMAPTNDNNRAEVHILANSKVIVEDGGTLRIHGNSSLHIQEGAYLILEDGAVLEMEGDNSIVAVKGFLVQKGGSTLRILDKSKVLIEDAGTWQLHGNPLFDLQDPLSIIELQGKIDLWSTAQLNFTALNKGFIRLNQSYSIADMDTYWKFASSNKIHLSSTDTTQKVLEVVRPTYIPSTLDSIIIDDAKVMLTSGAELQIYANFKSSEVNYSNYGAKGLWLYGQSTMDVRNSYFYGGSTGLGALLTFYGNDLELNNCKFFHQTERGLYTEGQGVSLRHCRFKDTYEGWQAKNMTQQCVVFETQLVDNSWRGINFVGQSGVGLHIESSLIDNSNVGLYTDHTSLRMQCTRVKNCNRGLFLENGYVDLGSEARNTITNNDIGVDVFDMLDIRLKTGENHFFGNIQYFLYGHMNKNHLLGSPSQVDISDNNIPMTGGSLPISLKDHNNNPISMINYTNTGLYSTWPCYVVPTALNELVLQYPSFKVVNTTNYSNYYFSDALFDAIGYVSDQDSTRDDLTAISRIKELLEVDLGTTGDEENFLKDYGFRMMMKALTNAYEQGLIPLNRALDNQTEDPYLHDVIEEIDDRLSGIDAASATAYEEEYQLNLQKAHMYRLAEHYDYALTILQNAGSWASGNDLFETDYWRCVCQAEEDLLDGIIDAETYLEQKLVCQSSLQAKRDNRPIIYGETTPVDYKPGYEENFIERIYPNPAMDYTEIVLSENLDNLGIEIYSMDGVKVLSKELRDGKSRFRIELNDLPSGAYILRLKEGNRIMDTEKLSKL